MKFLAVRIVARIHVAIGTIILLSSVAVLLVALAKNPEIGPEARVGALTALGLFLAGLFIIALGQLLEVFLKIEENTRPRNDKERAPDEAARP